MAKIETKLHGYTADTLCTSLERIEVEGDGKSGFTPAELEKAKTMLARLIDVKNDNPIIQSMSAVDMAKLVVELKIAIRHGLPSLRKYTLYFDKDRSLQKWGKSECSVVEHSVEGAFLLVLSREKSVISASIDSANFDTEGERSKICCYSDKCPVLGP